MGLELMITNARQLRSRAERTKYRLSQPRGVRNQTLTKKEGGNGQAAPKNLDAWVQNALEENETVWSPSFPLSPFSPSEAVATGKAKAAVTKTRAPQ